MNLNGATLGQTPRRKPVTTSIDYLDLTGDRLSLSSRPLGGAAVPFQGKTQPWRTVIGKRYATVFRRVNACTGRHAVAGLYLGRDVVATRHQSGAPDQA